MSDIKKQVIKNTYYSNWCDNWGYPLAFWLVTKIKDIPGITPNKVTITAFIFYTLGSISLFTVYPFHQYIAAFLILAGFVGDDMDGQLARINKMSSKIGDFLDKVLDVLKIFIVTASAGAAAYLATGAVLYVYLGFVVSFFFNFRYYIKLETMFARINNDEGYLEKSNIVRSQLASEIEEMYEKKSKSFVESIYVIWHKHRTFLFLDEAEIAFVIALGSIFQRIDLALWVLAIGQVLWGIFRFYERGGQIKIDSERLYYPLRK
jgi:phosphatidylglycerophosphate synthase